MVTKNKEKGVEVVDIRFAVEQSAIAQMCPEDRIDDVWDVIHTMELPQSQKQIDNDVLYVMHGLGLK